MAEVVVTVSEVQPGAAAADLFDDAAAGEDVAAGEVVYVDDSDSYKAKLAQADNAQTEARAAGVLVSSAANGQRVRYQRHGDVTLGASAALVVGETYVVAQTPGKIQPLSDVAAGDWVTIVGVAVSASVLRLALFASRVQRAA